MSAAIRRFSLDTSHFGRQTLARRISEIPVERLVALVADSRSVAQVLERIGLPLAGRAHRELSNRLRALAIETSHLRGQAWSRGETAMSDRSVAKGSARRKFADADVFVARSRVVTKRAKY